MAVSYEFKWDAKDLESRIAALPTYVDEKMQAMVDEMVPKVETRMKERAPWTDRGRPFIGHKKYVSEYARAGLWASADHQDLGGGLVRHTITAGHTASYGIYLETIKSGKWAIVMPTLVPMGRSLMYSMAGFLNDLEAPPVYEDVYEPDITPVHVQEPDYYAERGIRATLRTSSRGKLWTAFKDTRTGRFISKAEVKIRLGKGVKSRWKK